MEMTVKSQIQSGTVPIEIHFFGQAGCTFRSLALDADSTAKRGVDRRADLAKVLPGNIQTPNPSKLFRRPPWNRIDETITKTCMTSSIGSLQGFFARPFAQSLTVFRLDTSDRSRAISSFNNYAKRATQSARSRSSSSELSEIRSALRSSTIGIELDFSFFNSDLIQSSSCFNPSKSEAETESAQTPTPDETSPERSSVAAKAASTTDFGSSAAVLAPAALSFGESATEFGSSAAALAPGCLEDLAIT
jgi:hypothetical protein